MQIVQGPARARIGLFALVTWSVVSAVCADNLDIEFLAGLRARRLYRLAEKQALERWHAEGASADTRVGLAIELARTYAEWAVASPPAARPPLWERAHQVTAEFARIAPDHPRQALIDVQDALTELAAGELARLEVTGTAETDPFESAKHHLRQAVRGMIDAAERIELLLREVRLARTEPTEGDWTIAKLEGLTRNVTIELARALRNQALCYPVGSEDRVNSLTRALEQLARPGVAVGQDALGWRAQLAQLTCLRLLDHGDECRQQMRAMLDAKPPDWVTLRIEAERVRCLAADGDLSSALAAVQKGRTLHGLASPQLDFAHLEVLLAAWQSDHNGLDQAEIATLAARTTAQVRMIRAAHGPAAARRAEMLVGRAFSAPDTTGSRASDLDALRMAAESLYRAGRTVESVAAYDRAAAAARKRGDSDRAFRFALIAAAIERQADHLQLACDRFCRLAESMPQHARATEAHRSAILCAADLVRRATETAERSRGEQLYTSLLQHHMTAWPDSPTADDARFWQGQWLESDRAWQKAIAAYQSVRPGSEHFEAAAGRVAVLYERLLKGHREPGARGRLVQEATQFLQPLITGPDHQWPKAWTPLQRSLAVALARMHLRYAGDGPEYSRRLLTAALAVPPGADVAWQAAAQALLAEALFLQDKVDEAAALVRQIPDKFLHFVELIVAAPQRLRTDFETGQNVSHGRTETELPDDSGPAAKQPAENAAARAELVLHITDRLNARPGGMDEPVRKRVDRARAAALAALNRLDEALSLYTHLVEKHPSDGDLQEYRAFLLGQTGRVKDLLSALRVWHEVERRSKPGGPRWFRARYARCESLVRLDRRAEAVKLVRLTTALHPELGGETMRRAFGKLGDE